MKINSKIETTVEALLKEKQSGISKSKIKEWIKYGHLYLNGTPVQRIDEVIKLGDTLELSTTKPPVVKSRFKPKFTILFEDEDLIAAIKPAGILSSGEGKSFIKEVLTYLRENSKKREDLYPIHRLDREVSGIILFARSEKIQQKVKEHWKENSKIYHALVHGQITQDEGRIESYLTDDPRTLLVSSTKNPINETSKLAITHFKVLKRLKDYTHLEVKLETGRKNQIRVHLSSMGNPIVGDRRYGADDTYLRQIRLYATYFSFNHPTSNKLIELKSDPFKGFLNVGSFDEKY